MAGKASFRHPTTQGPSRASIVPQPSGTSAPSRRSRTTIIVARPVYLLSWWFVLALHLIVGVFVLFTGFSHLVLSLPAVHIATLALEISIPLKRLSGVSYVVVALFHFRSLVRTIHRSITAGRLVLGRQEATAASQRIVQPKKLTIVRRFVRMWQKVFGPDGYLSITGRYFAGSMAVRECVEVVMQTYQTLSLSHAVSRAWINQFAVASVVMNCWSSTIVRFAFSHRSVAASRLLHVVVDMYLDFVFGLVLPVCVLLPYALAFDWSTGSYPSLLLLDDAWVANGVAESRQVLITSYIDYFASLLPQYGIFSCLMLLKKLLRRQQPTSLAPAMDLAAIVANEAPATTSTTALPTARESRAVRAASIGMAVWGAGVLALHVRAQAISSVSFEGCSLQSRPWFVSNVSCSIAYLNCYRRGVNGSAAEMEEILALLHRPALTRIIFAHCAALHVPDTIQQFPAMYSINVYNSTLVDWSASAGITQAAHPKIMVVTFGKSDVPAVPPALLHDHLPTSLTWVGFYDCSLAKLPEDIGDVWAHTSISVLALERTRVRRLPSSLAHMRWDMLWLAGSLLEELPENLLANSTIKVLWLSGNPLQAVPGVVDSTVQLSQLFVEDTNVSALPAWATSWLKTHQQASDNAMVSFSGSPVCTIGNSVYSTRVCAQNFGTRRGAAPYEFASVQYPL